MATLQNSKWTADTHYLLIHGSWHAGWCWDDVGSEIEAAGASYTALDLPGHGSHALIPKSYAAAPLHGADFETKISPIAKLNAADLPPPSLPPRITPAATVPRALLVLVIRWVGCR